MKGQSKERVPLKSPHQRVLEGFEFKVVKFPKLGGKKVIERKVITVNSK